MKDGPADAPVFMLMAHMDEVSMVVTYTGDGFARFEFVGSINPAVVVGQPVLVMTQSGNVPGVVCSPSVHLMQSETELWIDVGPRIDKVEPGDPIIFDTTPPLAGRRRDRACDQGRGRPKRLCDAHRTGQEA